MRLLINRGAWLRAKIESQMCKCVATNCREKVEYCYLQWLFEKNKFAWYGFSCAVHTTASRRYDLIRVSLSMIEEDTPLSYIEYDNPKYANCFVCGCKASRVDLTLLWSTVYLKGFITRYCSRHVVYSAPKSITTCYLKGANNV